MVRLRKFFKGAIRGISIAVSSLVAIFLFIKGAEFLYNFSKVHHVSSMFLYGVFIIVVYAFIYGIVEVL